MVRFNRVSTAFYLSCAPVPKLYLTHCLLIQSMKLTCFLDENIEVKRKREAEGIPLEFGKQILHYFS